jgi:5-methylcytosine-specific restriction endonuclease McrA
MVRKTKKRTDRQRLVDSCDKLVSIIVRLRDCKCVRCGAVGERDEKGRPIKGLQASHWFGRQNMMTRFDEKNLDALCGGCHLFWWHGDKTETIAREEWRKRFKARFNYLTKKLKNIPLSFQADTFWLSKQERILKDRLKEYES